MILSARHLKILGGELRLGIRGCALAGFLLDIDDVVAAEPAIEQLSPREREVAEYIAPGYSYRRTAAAMFVSVKTVETHMSHILVKLGVASRHELAARAFEEGFVSPQDT